MLGVIFDFNGTMFFDEDFQEISWKNYIRKKTGHDISHEEFQHCIHGRNSADSLIFSGTSVSPVISWMHLRRKRSHIPESLPEKQRLQLADGLTDFLDLLKEHKIPYDNRKQHPAGTT